MSIETKVEDMFETDDPFEPLPGNNKKIDPLGELMLEPRRFDRATGAPWREETPWHLGKAGVELEHVAD